jgi:DNA-binding NarL/FixJ family response regulator
MNELHAAADLRRPPPGPASVPAALRLSPEELVGDDALLLSLLANGLMVGAVARRLNLSERTVRRRLRSLCDRLGVETPVQAVVWAVRIGVV